MSDGRFKEEKDIDIPGLIFINQLRPVMYTINTNKIQRYLLKSSTAPVKNTVTADTDQIIYSGLIAQEVEKSANALNFPFSGVDAPKNEHDLYGLRYASFTIPLIKVIARTISRK